MIHVVAIITAKPGMRETMLEAARANIPAVLVGEKLAQKFPLSRIRFVAAALFAVFGVLILLGVDVGMGLGR